MEDFNNKWSTFKQVDVTIQEIDNFNDSDVKTIKKMNNKCIGIRECQNCIACCYTKLYKYNLYINS